MSKNKWLTGAGLFALAVMLVIVSVPAKVFAVGTDITSTSITGFVAPVFGVAPQVVGTLASTDAGTEYNITSITWSGSPSTFADATAYTATVVLTSIGTYDFATVFTPTVNTGTPTAGVVGGSGTGNTLTFTVVFPTTGVNLGGANNYIILAESGISTTGTTSIVGAIGISPAAASYLTGFGQTMDSGNAFSTSPLVAGHIYASNYAGGTTSADLTTAITNMGTAYTRANSAATTVSNVGAGHLAGLSLVPGVYTFGTNVDITDNMTLNGSGVYIFQIAGNLNISSAKSVTLSGGAVPANIFWAVAGSTTLGTTSTFEGNILDQTNIAMLTGATLNGKALAQTAVTLDANSIADPVVGSVSAVGTSAAIAHNQSLTYTLTTGTFSGTAGIVPGNWTLAGTDVGDLGTISSVVLSNGNKVATIIVSGTVVIAHNYTVAPAQATFVTGFTAPAAATATVSAKIITGNISGVVAPVTGATPSTSISSGTGYTAALVWSGSPTTFTSLTPYTATITLTPIDGTYTLTGVTANQFTVSGAQISTNPINSGVITAVFIPTDTVAGGGGGQISGGGGAGNSNGNGSSVPPVTPAVPPVTTVVTTQSVPIAGCSSNTGFSITTGQSCSGSTTITTTTVNNNGTTTTTVYNFGTFVLKKGSTGAAVKQLQMFLNKNLNINLVTDGLLGPRTIAIVKQWQEAHGLVADGLIGVKTKALMNSIAQ
jgi:hypothetical protein